MTDGEFDHILAPLKGEKDNVLSGCGDVMAVDGKDLVSSTNATVLEGRAVRELHRETSRHAQLSCVICYRLIVRYKRPAKFFQSNIRAVLQYDVGRFNPKKVFVSCTLYSAVVKGLQIETSCIILKYCLYIAMKQLCSSNTCVVPQRRHP